MVRQDTSIPSAKCASLTGRKYKLTLRFQTQIRDFVNLAIFLVILWPAIFAQTGYSQLTDRFDCSQNPNFGQINQDNLTREELIAQMDRELVRELSEEDRCDRSSDSTSGSGGGGNGNSGSGNGNSDGSDSNNSAPEGINANPPNQLSASQQSQRLTESLISEAELQLNSSATNSSQEGSNGAAENRLVKSDANAELIARLEARLQETSDPNIRTQLEENIQQLKSQN